MKKTINLIIILFLALAMLLILPNICKAATARDEETLNDAIQSAESGSTIEIQNNITITKPITVTKEVIIDGKGYTLAGSTEWTSTSGNQTMFTASSSSAKLTLKDIDLNNGPKYGIQAYDGGKVILDNVGITGFRYGGILVNGGYVEVIDLHLGYNGTGANNGIEIDQGASVSSTPTLVMNGTLTSDSTENVVRPAENGYLTEFIISNTETTVNKVVIAGDKVVLTDENDKVISETTIPEKVTPNVDESAKKVIITLINGEKTNRITVNEGETITKEQLDEYITIEEGYEVVGYFTDKDYKNEFDFKTKLDKDTTIYIKIVKIEETEKPEETVPETKPEPEKDDVPKTGVESYLSLSILSIIISATGIMYIRKKNLK